MEGVCKVAVLAPEKQAFFKHAHHSPLNEVIHKNQKKKRERTTVLSRYTHTWYLSANLAIFCQDQTSRAQPRPENPQVCRCEVGVGF
jgi:hypothetical protein